MTNIKSCQIDRTTMTFRTNWPLYFCIIINQSAFCSYELYPGVTSFRQCKEQYYISVCNMHALSKEIEHICINKILIYNHKLFRQLFHPKRIQNNRTNMYVLCLQWCHQFSAVGRIWHGEINKFTKSLNVSSQRLKKQYFTKNRLKTNKTHKLSI